MDCFGKRKIFYQNINLSKCQFTPLYFALFRPFVGVAPYEGTLAELKSLILPFNCFIHNKITNIFSIYKKLIPAKIQGYFIPNIPSSGQYKGHFFGKRPLFFSFMPIFPEKERQLCLQCKHAFKENIGMNRIKAPDKFSPKGFSLHKTPSFFLRIALLSVKTR